MVRVDLDSILHALNEEGLRIEKSLITFRDSDIYIA